MARHRDETTRARYQGTYDSLLLKSQLLTYTHANTHAHVILCHVTGHTPKTDFVTHPPVPNADVSYHHLKQSGKNPGVRTKHLPQGSRVLVLFSSRTSHCLDSFEYVSKEDIHSEAPWEIKSKAASKPQIHHSQSNQRPEGENSNTHNISTSPSLSDSKNRTNNESDEENSEVVIGIEQYTEHALALVEGGNDEQEQYDKRIEAIQWPEEENQQSWVIHKLTHACTHHQHQMALSHPHEHPRPGEFTMGHARTTANLDTRATRGRTCQNAGRQSPTSRVGRIRKKNGRAKETTRRANSKVVGDRKAKNQ